jgi:Chromatin assembly factor 1 subunit A
MSHQQCTRLAALTRTGACSPHVAPRRPLARDPDMDYDVMSDEEWEEEPEGEALDGADDGDDDDVGGSDEEAAGGFMVSGARRAGAGYAGKVAHSRSLPRPAFAGTR